MYSLNCLSIKLHFVFKKGFYFLVCDLNGQYVYHRLIYNYLFSVPLVYFVVSFLSDYWGEVTKWLTDKYQIHCCNWAALRVSTRKGVL